MQERLDELGFFVGEIDGQFGPLFEQALWAYQKLVMNVPRDEATSVLTDEMWQDMQRGISIEPMRLALQGPGDARTTSRSTSPSQVVVFFVDDKPAMIVHISSGDGQEWREVVTIDLGEYGNDNGTEPLVRREIGVSLTPGWRVPLRPDGRRTAQQRPRRDVGPGVLQLRHRHARGDQRAARTRRRTAASACRRRPGGRSTSSSTSATRCSCGTASRSPSTTRRTPTPRTPAAHCRSSTASIRRTRRRPRRRRRRRPARRRPWRRLRRRTSRRRRRLPRRSRRRHRHPLRRRRTTTTTTTTPATTTTTITPAASG